MNEDKTLKDKKLADLKKDARKLPKWAARNVLPLRRKKVNYPPERASMLAG